LPIDEIVTVMPATDVHLDPAQIKTIARAFGLTNVVARKITGKVYSLQTNEGMFVLRFYNAGVTRAHIDSTQKVRSSLCEAGLPVVTALCASAGSSVIEMNGLLGEVQPWIHHTADGGSWENLVIAAGVLPRIHATLGACTALVEQHDDPWRTPGELLVQIQNDRPRLRALSQRHGSNIEQYVDQAIAILDTLHARELLDKCAKQLTHGDFQGSNLLFGDNGLVGIIDFELLDYRPRLYDLAWPLVFWRYFGTSEGPYTKFDWEHARACCSAYAHGESGGSAEVDWATLPLLMAYIPVRGIADAGGEESPLEEILAFATALEFSEWLVRHPAEVLRRLRD
jgi:Ser/Thr protein kinase RdoA (MazF antagonist)